MKQLNDIAPDLADALRAARGKLADAKAHAQTTAVNLERIRASEAGTAAELDQWHEAQAVRESAHQAIVIAAITGGQAAPPYIHDVSLVAERERLEAHKRVTGHARVKFEAERADALRQVEATELGVINAANLIITAEATEVARRYWSLKDEVRDLRARLVAFNAKGYGQLPAEFEIDTLRIPANLLSNYNPVAHRAHPLADVESNTVSEVHHEGWRRRRDALVAGTDLDSAATSEVAA